MKPEATESSLNTNNAQAPSLQPTARSLPTGAPRRGNTGNAAKYGPIDRAAESWTDRELTECLRRNLYQPHRLCRARIVPCPRIS